MRIAHFTILIILFVVDNFLSPAHCWCLRTIFAASTSIQSVDFSPDGEYILTGQTSGRVMLWKTDTLQTLKTYQFTHKLWQAVFSPNQSLIAVVGQDDYIDIIDASSLSLIKTINTNQNKVYDADFYSSQLLITCGDDRKTKLWNVTSGTLITLVNNQNIPYACQCGGNLNWVVVAGNNFVQSYDLQGSGNNLVQYYDFNQGPSTFQGTCIRPNTNYSISVSPSGQILQSQLDSLSTDQYIAGSTGSLYACAYSPDTSYFAVVGSNKDVFLFNATSRANKLQATLFANSTSNFKSAQFSPDSNNLVVGNQNGTLYFYKRFCSGCPVGSFPDQTTCTLCSAKMVGCSICTSSSSCKSCMAGYYISSSSCKSCAVIQGCANCNSSSNCTLCLPNYYQTGLTCTRCLSKQYGCVQCTGPLQCLECDKNSYLSGGICIKCTTLTKCIYCNSSSYCLQCIAGYYQNSGVCTSCESAVNLNCLACHSATNCSVCVSGYRLNSSFLCQKCSAQCIFCNSTNHCFDCVQQMYVTSSYTCDFCVHPCVTCTSTTFCLSCVESYYLSSSGVCTNCIIPCFSCNSSVYCQSCIVGYYLDTVNHLCIICNQTYSNCRECTANLCLACELQYLLTQSHCENCSAIMKNCILCNSTTFCEQCLKGFYPTGLSGNDSCGACNSDCSSCVSSTNCSACIPGYYLLNYGCVACPGNCLTCKSSSTSTCYSCKQGYYLSTVSLGSCLNCSVIAKCVACHNSSYCIGCAAGYFLSSPTTCTVCTPPCVQCKTSVTDCLACDLGYYFYTSGGLGKCSQCNYGCSECLNSSSVCINCITGYYYNSTTYQCNPCSMTGCNICNNSTSCIVCSTGYYPVSGVCRSCSLNIAKCLKCNVLGTTCSICDYGYCLSSSNTSCLSCSSFISNCQQCRTSSICETCISGFYLSGTSCSVCSTGCNSCSNFTTCQVCKNDYILLSSKLCQLCEDAIQGCRICSSTTVCSDCLLDYYLDGSVCSLCRSSIEGCQSCTNSSVCTYCSIYYQLQANSTCEKCQNIYTNCQVCGNSTIKCLQCQLGYYLNNISNCITCNPGSTQGCIKCLSNLTCQQCMSGYYYNTTNNSCLKCDYVFSNCIYCSSSVCLQCQSGYYLSSGTCARCTGEGCQVCYQFNSSQCITCNTRYYKSGTQCLLCSSSMLQCQECSISTACTECSIGFYVTNSNICNLCSNSYNGCSICSSSGCIDCQANFFLNQTDKKCLNCTDFIPGCAFCVSEAICLSCQNGYYIVNQSCEFCATIPGCLYCLNDTDCTYCQQSYFMCSSNNNNSCCLCSDYIPGCYACVDNVTCISCVGHYQTIGGVCVEIRPEVLKNSNRILLKSYFIDESNLKHILYAQDFLFLYIEQNWTAQAEIVLIDKNYTQTQLIIYRVEWSQAMDQLIFFTNNPITDKLSQSMKNMPFTKQSRRLLADTSVNLDFNLKLMISEKAAQDVMPSLNQIGDLYLDYPYFDASFYQSYIRNQPYYYFIFGFIITLTIVAGFCIKSSCYPSLADKGGIVPHILAIKTGALGLYPTFAQYVNYCYGFMTADFPWINQYLGNLYGKLGDLSPDPLRMYYVNLSLISTYFLAIIAILVIWLLLSLLGYLIPQHTRKLQSIKTFVYNFFAFGAIISGSLSLQGIILNSIHSLSMNTIFYILGVIIYLGIFVEIFYSWFTNRQFVVQLLKIEKKQLETITVSRHLQKMRIFVKATLLSLMHLAPLYILSIVVFTQIAVIVLDHMLTKRGKVNPKLQIISHLLANASLLLIVLVHDALVGIILVSILIVAILVIELIRFFYEIEKYLQIGQELSNQNEKANEVKSNEINKITFHESSMALKQAQEKDRSISVVPLMKSRDPSKRKKIDESNVLFSINDFNFDNN